MTPLMQVTVRVRNLLTHATISRKAPILSLEVDAKTEELLRQCPGPPRPATLWGIPVVYGAPALACLVQTDSDKPERVLEAS